MIDTQHNRLGEASSPYLRQHAANPVHWQPWDNGALEYARTTDTPILLSIGYSACHWCHVMAHQCFENPEIAAAMNAAFVSIKLDREERPDIDRVYQLAHQALTGRSGGWPLTAFLDPQDLSPFYMGTYFPPAARGGIPGCPDVLARVRGFFDTRRDELREQTAQLRQWLEQVQAPPATVAIDPKTVVAKALQRLHARFDAQWGGSTGAPKFPRTAELEWLLDTGDDDARRMAHRTLAMMAARGLQDHLGGGFFRYCVDQAWTIPHFEKMLYDNAQLLPLYARVAADDRAAVDLRDAATGALRGITDWLERDMTAPDGAFYSAVSADSEGGEGRFYLWTREQFDAAVPGDASKLSETAFGLDHPANFERRAWHLLRAMPLADVAARCGEAAAAAAAQLDEASRRLLDVRAQRPRPPRDDKILTAWNALAISGLARAARLSGNAGLGETALRALDALRLSVWIEGTLYANAATPDARVPGFLDDHALLLAALLESLQLRFDTRDLAWAIALADALCNRFIDPASGAFWFSTDQHATPLARSRDWPDDALPNGNATTIRALLRLGHLVGGDRYPAVAERALRAAGAVLEQYPDVCPSLLRALAEHEHPRPLIVIRCPGSQQIAWRTAANKGLRDAGIAPGGDPADVFIVPAKADVPALLAERRARTPIGSAYVCRGLTCLAPIDAPAELVDALGTLRAP